MAPPAGASRMPGPRTQSARSGRGSARQASELPAPAPRCVDLCGIELRPPVINASGTFDAIAARRVYRGRAPRGLPLRRPSSRRRSRREPRAGNAPQRIWETPAGMINSIGLPNKGLDGFLAEDLPLLAELPVPLIVSVMGTSREEFARLVSAVAEREEVAAIELNVSCPNVGSGLIVGEQPAETEALLEALRPLTAKPLIVKLTPNVADPAAVALAAERGGCGRGLDDQHAEGERDRSAHPASRPRRRPRGLVGPSGAADRGRPGARRRGRGRAAGRSAWEASPAAPMRSNSSPRERRGGGRNRELQGPAGRLAGSPRSFPLCGSAAARREPILDLDSRSR